MVTSHRTRPSVQSRAAEELAEYPLAYARLVELNRPDLRFHEAARARFHADLVEVLGDGGNAGAFKSEKGGRI